MNGWKVGLQIYERSTAPLGGPVSGVEAKTHALYREKESTNDQSTRLQTQKLHSGNLRREKPKKAGSQ